MFLDTASASGTYPTGSSISVVLMQKGNIYVRGLCVVMIAAFRLQEQVCLGVGCRHSLVASAVEQENK